MTDETETVRPGAMKPGESELELAAKTERLVELLSADNPHLRAAAESASVDDELSTLEDRLVDRFRAGLNQWKSPGGGASS